MSGGQQAWSHSCALVLPTDDHSSRDPSSLRLVTSRLQSPVSGRQSRSHLVPFGQSRDLMPCHPRGPITQSSAFSFPEPPSGPAHLIPGIPAPGTSAIQLCMWLLFLTYLLHQSILHRVCDGSLLEIISFPVHLTFLI